MGDFPRDAPPTVFPVWPASNQDRGRRRTTRPSWVTSAFRLAHVDEWRHLVDQRELVPRLGRRCLDAPQVDGKIYRL